MGSILLPPLYQPINYKTTTKQSNMSILSAFNIPSTLLVKLEENVEVSIHLAFSHNNSILTQIIPLYPWQRAQPQFHVLSSTHINSQ